ncbi:putative cyclin-T1-1 isoform X1 [Coffea arabica]|uniref:Cyclin-T1-1 isoform X1 n=1 Tax=Coffea arabica TaxID=13443 RepID=A0A6P6WLZ2_COFAR|nr:cyclin-T1-3-like [Coffea arabica]
MTLAQTYHYGQSGPYYGDPMSYGNRHNDTSTSSAVTADHNYHFNGDFNYMRNYGDRHDFSRNCRVYNYNNKYYARPEGAPSLKRRKFSNSTWEDTGRSYQQPYVHDKLPSKWPSIYGNFSSNDSTFYSQASSAYGSHLAVAPTTRSNVNVHYPTSPKRDRSMFEDDDDVLFMSRDEIERFSPSRKDGIDAKHETHLRYSYCAFLQNLGLQLELPQTTIATAMVLCHRFFVRRSHACHDRFLIATAALFLAAKSEETPRPLNNVLRASCEILHNRDFAFLSYTLPVDWFEQYRERITEAEQMILMTLNFELSVQHPYTSLTSTLEKLGFSQTFLVNLALNLISEGLRSSLWLQFKPHQIAAGAAYLAAKFLNMDLASYHNVWKEFETPPNVLKDIAQQLMELF